KGASCLLTLTAERHTGCLNNFEAERLSRNEAAVARANPGANDSFGRQLALAVQAFVVRRQTGRSIIAGYPWFLGWGRDSLICARGLLAAGMRGDGRQLRIGLGRLEESGALPNR